MHIESTVLMCSVVGSGTGQYMGYCGIKNVRAEKWEVAIELLKVHTGQGVGTLAVRGLLGCRCPAVWGYGVPNSD